MTSRHDLEPHLAGTGQQRLDRADGADRGDAVLGAAEDEYRDGDVADRDRAPLQLEGAVDEGVALEQPVVELPERPARVGGHVRGEAVAVRERAGDAVFRKDDVLDRTFLNLLAELGIGKRTAGGLRGAAENRGDEEHGKEDAAPDHHALHPGVALRFLVVLHSENIPINASIARSRDHRLQDRNIRLNDNAPSAINSAFPPRRRGNAPD